jgi:outer membrane receptor for ferrienterochelin and colicin
MHLDRKTLPLRLLLCAALALALAGAPAFAQITTGSLSGVVTDSSGARLPGVSVAATHQPTGTTYTATTGADGRFTLPSVRVGGPYSVKAELEGFKAEEKTGVFVGLGQTSNVSFALELGTVSETVTVVGEAESIINPYHTGSTSAVSTQQIEDLPTVRRSLQDFARTNPYFVVDAQDSSATRINVAGRNNRYNTIQIDGAVNNDLFGLADTGTPGGQTDAQPISLDAVAELQLAVSPYDVRQGGFTGGAINAVTRSGTNAFHGSAYGSKRDQAYVGDGPFNNPISDFSEDQYGFRLGGPIQQDRFFFFVNGELNRRDAPSGVSADGSTGDSFNNPAEAAEFRSFLSSTYGYDPGTLGDISGKTDSDLAFLRLDGNLNDSNQLTLRHNYVKSSRDVIAGRSRSVYQFDTAQYAFADKTNSTVLQLNSVLGSSFNEGRLGYQTIRDVRAVPVTFPSIEIGGTGPRRGELIAGTERFSGANALDQDILEVTDDFTFLKGSHTITVGTHNEIFKFKNLFLADFYGYYYFPTLQAFEDGLATQYSVGFANGSDPRRATEFEIRQYGFYGGDSWRVNDRFTLSLGLRLDKPSYVDSPSRNPDVQTGLGFDTSKTPSDSVVFSPRVGFNFDPKGDGRQQVRGGIGVFAGRTPYVWVSNAYANTGVESTALTFNGSIPFNPDPNSQPHNLGASGTPTVDLIDPGFELPRVLRTTLGYDRELFWGIRGSVEVIWSQTQKDVFYVNSNKAQTGTSPLDGRPTYSTVNSSFRDAPTLTNTSKGDEKTFSIQLRRPVTNGLSVSASYAYMDTSTAMDATSSRAISNWQFRPTRGNIFEDDTFSSAFEMKHRFNAAVAYNLKTGPVGHTFALFLNVQSGRPYSLLMGGDPNRDGFTSNDMLFVPASEDAIILKNSSGAVIPYSVFADFLRAAGVSPTAGRILSPNDSTEPWSHLLDFHYALDIPVRSTKIEVSLDILNLLNLIDSGWGVVKYVNFQTTTPVAYRGQDAATGKPIYQENFNGALDPGSQYSTSDLRSRWQAKFGLRVTF